MAGRPSATGLSCHWGPRAPRRHRPARRGHRADTASWERFAPGYIARPLRRTLPAPRIERKDARPGIVTHLGVGQGSWVALLVDRAFSLTFALRPLLVLADQVKADRRADDVGLAEKVIVVEVAGIEKIVQRQARKIVRQVDHTH